MLKKLSLRSDLHHEILISNSLIHPLSNFFEDLPIDPYLSQAFRMRRFSRFEFYSGRFSELPQTAFVQSSKTNSLLGGMNRQYEPLSRELKGSEEFTTLLSIFKNDIPVSSHDVIYSVHQIRIVSDPIRGLVGSPTPEGVHQDEAAFVGISVIAKENALGAETHLFEEREGNPSYTTALQAGEMLIFDDQKLWHSTTPLVSLENHLAYRDVFIFTANFKN